MSTFAKSLRSARQMAGLTQEQLGFDVGVTKASVSAWENAREFPSFTTLLRLRQALNVSLDWLTGVSEEAVQHTAEDIGSYDPRCARTDREYALLQRFRAMSARRQDAFLEITRSER